MRKTSFVFRLLLVLITVCLVTSSFLAVKADDNVYDTKKKTYEIAVAYDNSGSMYGANTAAWYQAKYAMEIFASMLDLNGNDKLTIFPMHPVTVGGGGSTKRIEVKSVADIDKIHNMYTPSAGGTPFSAVQDAYNYLGATQKDAEKWLIVLTDGSIETADLQGKLEDMAKKVHVQYIPFGGIELVDSSGTDTFYASPSVTDEAKLQSTLISVCNKMFQRNELTGRLDGQALNIDLSMKKIIVFVQGQGAKINSLTDSSGNEVTKILDSGKRTYSELGAGGNYKNVPLPESVKNQSGQVVTFGPCKKGTYTLDYQDATSIQIFYEPDVTMVVELINDDGESVDFSQKSVTEGDYKVNVKIIDKATGESVENHELLGGKVDVDIKVTNSDGSEQSVKNGGKITLKPGENVKVKITATYLERYKITNEDDPGIFPWDDFTVEHRGAKLSLSLSTKQSLNKYPIVLRSFWKPIRVEARMDGAPLTDEQLLASKLDITVDSKQDIAYRVTPVLGESAYVIELGVDENGKATDISWGKHFCGVKYKFNAKLTATDPDGIVVNAKGDITVYVEAMPTLFWVLLVLLILLIIFLILRSQVIPPELNITFDDEEPDNPIRLEPNSGTITVFLRGSTTEIAFTAKTVPIKKFWKNSLFNALMHNTKMTFKVREVESYVDGLNITDGDVIYSGYTIRWVQQLDVNGNGTVTNTAISGVCSINGVNA